MTVTETFNIRDGSGKVYRVENFVVTVDTAMNTVELDGRFYHPDHGYVDVDTTDPFAIASGLPESGTVEITGDDSGATLTATSDGTYRLDIDIDGDGIPDSSETGNWASL